MASAVRPVRAAKACVICHKKKIKCDLDFTEGFQCSPCIRDGYECRPRERKRKRTYKLDSESPPPKIRRESTLLSPNSGASLAGGTKLAPNLSTAEASYQASSSANGAFSQPAAPVYAGFSVTSHDDASETTNATPGAGPSSARPGVGYTTTNASYLGRSEYIEAINDEEEAPPHSTRGLSAQDLEILKIQGAFEMPIRAYRESLIDNFWTRCWPWTPIVERNWIEGRPQNAISILLLQGMMLAGSRVSSSPVTYGPPEDFYKKGKMLFWMGAERDPMLMCVGALLLNWWNPEGPEHFSIDTSGFWLRIAVGLAYQIGLHREPQSKTDAAIRRRLWWSIVTRDCLINAGHGRPRAISLQKTDVLPPSVRDFEGDVNSFDLFSAYLGISMILGDLTQCFLQKGQFMENKSRIEDRTFRWMKTLPESLQLCYPQNSRPLRAYSFEARQLHVQYFISVIILNKTAPPSTTPSSASLLASSFVAGIFEDFLVRDELRYLGPIFTFYLLAAGVCLLSSYRYAGLWHTAEQDLQIVIKSQEELGKRWPSAIGSLKRITDVRDKVTKSQRSTYFPENNLTPEQMQFFDSFGADVCRSWDVLYHNSDTQHQPSAARDIVTAGILQELRTPGGLYAESLQEGPGIDGSNTMGLDAQLLDGPVSLDQYGGIGNWLFNDWEHGNGAFW
ncbi:hypothetical protein E2P81_ATG11536 [Venturia nashicola]|nr:hypothetical protein E2P81_ATG11536 [Venturia nashicola]